MKRKIFIALVMIIVLVCIIFLINKYNNNKIEVKVPKYSYFVKEAKNIVNRPNGCCDSSIELTSFRSRSYLKKFRDNYIENLPSCYDESYFYDADYGVTYSKYNIESKGIYKKITIEYQKGNYCKNEYIIDNDWIDILNNSVIDHNNFDYKSLLKVLETSKRLYFNDRIPFDEENKHQLSYIYNNLGYTLYFSVYDNNIIGIIMLDANDHKKYAIYDIGQDAKSFLESLQ